jgi:MEMO1 family protein
VFAHLEHPNRYIMLCPNHTGMGEPLSIMSEGSWLTPLGEVAIDTPLALALKSRFPLLREDSAAHAAEHALEVQLPFLQALVGEFTFVPIAVGTGHYEALSALGVTIAAVIGATQERVMIVASSDMNHYEDDATTRMKDSLAIEPMLALDAHGLHRVVKEEDISMCGYGPAVAMITAAKRLGATAAELVKYATSGDISGDREQVVGYAGIVVR